MKNKVNDCPICLKSYGEVFSKDKFRTYLKCSCCQLIFVPRSELIDMEIEKKRYELHNNEENDPSYEAYLRSIMMAYLPFLKEARKGLDFGCGKSALLSRLFSEHDIKVDSYDLHFLKNEPIWKKKYDFIILSEVIEHFRNPMEEMLKLSKLLNHKGKLLIKTKFYPSKADFEDWFYKRDITHVQFFCKEAMEKLVEKLGMESFEAVQPDLYIID